MYAINIVDNRGDYRNVTFMLFSLVFNQPLCASLHILRQSKFSSERQVNW